MSTSIKTCVEVKTTSGWQMSKLEVFRHPIPDWDTTTEDRRPCIERPFYWQSYGMMGFFAGIRNYSETIVLAEPRGLPDDTDDESVTWLVPYANFLDDDFSFFDPPEERLPKTVAEIVRSSAGDDYGHSWLSAAELLNFDYSQQFIDRRENPAVITTYREFLDDLYFEHLEALKSLGTPDEVRILFCFN